MKEFILKKLAGGQYVSGAEIAEILGVSRNAVWKAVQSLRDEGFIIESTASKGYRLSPDSNKLSAELIDYDGNMFILDSVSSTNDYAKKLAAEGAEDGTVIIAENQTSGKGRLGRSFVSPDGMGLYMSVVVRPDFAPEYAPLITSAASVASAEAVEMLCGEDVRIKWVNDLYMNGRKICGILTEASLGLEANTVDYAVIGIGINVRRHDFGELNNIVTSVEQETGRIIDRNRLCGIILERLGLWLSGIGKKSHLDEYRKRELLTGKMITANIGSQKISGRAVGIDENANLIVQTETSVINLSSGEANLIRTI